MDSVFSIIQAARKRPTGRALPPTNEVFASVAGAVEAHMTKYDASHDMSHVYRVLRLSQKILVAEGEKEGSPEYDPTVVLLAAILHDVTDKKYTSPADATGSKLDEILNNAGVSPSLCAAIIEIVNHVSYSTETRNPEKTAMVLSQHPELGIVQDADRLDAIGAIGIGRAFTFGGAKMPQSSMQGHRDHLTEKLVKLEDMMKTNTGKLMARERTQRIHQFGEWWDEEWQN